MDKITKAPDHLDAGKMTEEQLEGKLEKGIQDYLNGNVRPAAEVFEEFKKKHFKK